MGVKNFIEKIQNSDERTKRKWLVICSAVAMVVIVAFWVFYIKSIFEIPQPIQAETQASGPGFWDIFKNGASIVFNSIINNIKSIFANLTGSKTVIIQ